MENYIVFWLSQAVSQLGSSLTGYALVLWVYETGHSAMSVSLMSFCLYLPYIVLGLFCGGFIDTHSKKKIMLICDSIAALGTVFIFLLTCTGSLRYGHIYLVNTVIGAMNALQSPCTRIVTRLLVPTEKMEKASGLTALSDNFIAILAPVLAGALYAAGGLRPVLIADFCTFLFAAAVLAFRIRFDESSVRSEERISPFRGLKDGFAFLDSHRGILSMMTTMATVNFFTKITLENILSPMILARTGNDAMALAAVNAAMGATGILAGIWVSTKKESKDYILQMYGGCALSFLFGDLMFGLGRNTFMWCLAGIGANVFYPIIISAEEVVQARVIPEQLQGRVYSVRNAVQFGTMPAGLLAGGFLADRVFEPFMASGSPLASSLSRLVGTGEGSGMAVMFLCTGTIGILCSILPYFTKETRLLREEMLQSHD